MSDDVIKDARNLINTIDTVGMGVPPDAKWFDGCIRYARALLAERERAEKAEARVKELAKALDDLLRDAASDEHKDWWASLQRAHRVLEPESQP